MWLRGYGGLPLADHWMFEPIDALFQVFCFGPDQVAHVVEALVDVAKPSVDVVEALVHRVLQVVDTTVLKVDAKEVPNYYDCNRSPLVERIHTRFFDCSSIRIEPAVPTLKPNLRADCDNPDFARIAWTSTRAGTS